MTAHRRFHDAVRAARQAIDDDAADTTQIVPPAVAAPIGDTPGTQHSPQPWPASAAVVTEGPVAGAAVTADPAGPSPDRQPEGGTMTTLTLEPQGITEPGIYTMPEAEYHAQPALSNTEARRLLDCPAKYHWHKTHGQEHKSEFDFGKAAHALVLGVGCEVVVCDFDDWRTKDAKAARDKARLSGAAPVLAAEWDTVQAMAATLREHPIASALLNPDTGQAEQSLFWRSPDPFLAREVWLRARVDWLPNVPDHGRMIVPDYKTSRSAEARAFARSAADYEYHMQASHYLDGITTLLGVDDPAFVFIVQEKEVPYVVNVIELDAYALQIGRQRNADALARWVACTESGVWPGYSSDVEMVALPRYAEIAYEESQL